MKKRKKKNIDRALALKNNIVKFNNKVNLPIKNDIHLVQNEIINGIDVKIFKSPNIVNDHLNLQTDDLIDRRPLKDVLIKTHRILLLPSDKQKIHLLKWVDVWIDMYNKVLSIIKDERKSQSELLGKPLKYNEINLDNLERTKLKKDLKPFKNKLSKKTLIDIHVLDYCINDVLTMLKSSISNLKNNNCKKSRLRYIKKGKKSKIFKVENYSSITQKGILTSKLGKYLKSIPEVDYKKANSSLSTIQYKNGKFYMLIKKKMTIKKNLIKKQKIISLDPGHKTFLSGLSDNHLIEIGNKVDKKIKKILVKMDKIKEKRSKHIRYKRRCKRKYLLKHEKKLANYVNNLHWQTINYLTSNYNHILLGNYSTKSMVESDKSNKMNKRIGSGLKFYQFRTKLIYKCILRDCKFGLVDEYNTTRACSNCSALNNIGSSRKYICSQCEQIYPRDFNSTKNILLKAIQ